jgi:outer membrane protein TolC
MLVLILVLLCTKNVFAESLHDIVGSVYRENNIILAKRRTIESDDYFVKSSYSGFLPTVDASYNNTRNNYNNADIGYGAYTPPTMLQTNRYQLRLQQNVFNGFRDFNTMQKARSKFESTVYDAIVTEQDILHQVLQGYIGVLRYNELLRISDESIQTYLGQKKNIEQRYSVNDVTNTDFLQTELSLENAQIQREQTFQLLNSTQFALERFLNRNVEVSDEMSNVILRTQEYFIDLATIRETAEEITMNHPLMLYQSGILE